MGSKNSKTLEFQYIHKKWCRKIKDPKNALIPNDIYKMKHYYGFNFIGLLFSECSASEAVIYTENWSDYDYKRLRENFVRFICQHNGLDYWLLSMKGPRFCFDPEVYPVTNGQIIATLTGKEEFVTTYKLRNEVLDLRNKI